MNIIRTANYQEMSKHAGRLILEKIKSDPTITLGLATGSTPLGVYQFLIEDYQMNHTSYRKIQTFNLDEYIGIKKENPNSYYTFMKKNFFNCIDIPLTNTHIPDGTVRDFNSECRRYENLIKDKGGIDIQLLGLGQNGHIGFNEPGTPFESRTHIVELAQMTRSANARFFSSLADVPTKAITMGISTILESREIFLLASGSSKAEALAQLITGTVSENFPASSLKFHSNVTIIADDEALALI